MLDLLQKLINEHGSSTILRERLELVSDKYSTLEEKNQHLYERNSALEEQIRIAQAEIARFSAQVAEHETRPGAGDLTDVELRILGLRGFLWVVSRDNGAVRPVKSSAKSC